MKKQKTLEEYMAEQKRLSTIIGCIVVILVYSAGMLIGAYSEKYHVIKQYVLENEDLSVDEIHQKFFTDIQYHYNYCPVCGTELKDGPEHK